MPDVDPYRISLSVTDVNGRVTKWGPDEPDGRQVPQDLEWTTSIPGGYKDLTTSLFREFVRVNADNNIGDRVRAYSPGNQTVFDGFFSAFPKQLAMSESVEPAAVGWSALLNFDTGFQMPYVDRDMSKWGDMPLNRKVGVAGAAISFGDFSWSDGPGGLVCALPNQALGPQTIAELWYTAPAGIVIAKVMYIGADTSLPAGWATPQLLNSADDATSTASANAATLDSTLRSISPATPRRYLVWQYYSNGVAVTPAAGANRRLTALAVYGNHGLTTRAIDASTPDGIYNCDIVADIVTRCGQGILTFTTGAGGSIEPNTVIVAHLVFDAPTKAADALARASAFGINPLLLPEWGVYNDFQFFWRTPSADRLCWQARLSDGTKPRFEGDQLDDLYNGVIVQFTDPGGVQRVVGPPATYWYGGTALADATDPTLVDATSTNEINAHNFKQKWAVLQLTQTATTAGAIALGGVFLAVNSLPQRRGQIDITGLVQHPTEAQPQPAYMIKAGDYIQIPDSAESDVQRRIVGTRYSHQTRTLTADVGVTPFTVDALLEQMQAELVGVVG